MSERADLRVQYLRRLTDRVGIMRRADQGEPDHFFGYDTLDNALALRLAIRLYEAGAHDDASAWAGCYMQFLFQAMREGSRFAAHREALGHWSQDTVSPVELAQIARALAGASAGDVSGLASGRARALWDRVRSSIHDLRCPRSAAHWLLAIGECPPADQRALEDAASRLAARLIEQCYYAMRDTTWEWFDARCMPGDACMPHALWTAYRVLGDERCARVAASTTEFLIDELFEDGLFLPVGSRGSWSKNCERPVFDQWPTDVAATTELLRTAHEITGDARYAQYAGYAHAWFTGNNVKGISMLDDTTGGVYDALTAVGHAEGQGAAATVSYLLSAIAMRETRRRQPVEIATVVRLA